MDWLSILESLIGNLVGTILGVSIVTPLVKRKSRVDFIRTLNLLYEAIHSDILTIDFVSGVAGELIRTTYRLPFGSGGFKAWAAQKDLFPE